MSIAEVAKRFTEALKAQKYDVAEAMWSDDVVSIESMEGPMQRLEGREAVHGKGAWWFGAHEIHSFATCGPFLNGDQFALIFNVDVTQKESGNRIQMEEVAVYTVRNGKVTEERFFN
jgi:ketosteroid isomerase-like protein